MKKFSLLESFKYSDEEIEDFFLEFIDDKKFTLVSGFLTKDNRFFKDVAGVNKTTRKCKMVTIRLEEVANGIQGPSGGGRSLTSFEALDKILSEIKKFYARSGESPNFIIEPYYDDIEITFFLTGGIVEESDTETQDTIIGFQKELVEICKKRGYKRVSLKGNNWCEISTPVRDQNIYYGIIDVFNKLSNGNLQGNERNQPLIDWYNRVTTSGLTLSRLGGDNQIVIQLKKS
jgi:hypothetical protein